ncbi:DUF2637 domain-containing protein [Micromonospora sp. NPDC004704]
MTTPTMNSVYPKPVQELLPDARDLVGKLGELPSQNRLMKELKVGAPKARELRKALENVSTALAVAPAAVTDEVPPPPVAPVADTRPDLDTAPDMAESTVAVPPVVVPSGSGASPQPIPSVEPVPNIITAPAPAVSVAPVTGEVKRSGGRGWAYLGVLLGGVVSIAANIAHTYLPPTGAGSGWSPEPLAVVFSVFWPIALFVAVEILARTPWKAGWQSVLLRFVGVLPVALVAALVSYRHLSGLLAHYGEDALTSALGPLAVDGLMLMASAALIVTARHKSRT